MNKQKYNALITYNDCQIPILTTINTEWSDIISGKQHKNVQYIRLWKITLVVVTNGNMKINHKTGLNVCFYRIYKP